MRPLCIIPARAGSKRLPGKNRETVGGIALWRRATHCIPDDCQAVVVTDDNEILRSIDAHPSPIFGRLVLPDSLAQDDIAMRDVVRFAAAESGKFTGVTWSHVALIQPTSPLRRMQDVEECLRIADKTGCDSVVSITARNRFVRAGHSGTEATLPVAERWAMAHTYERNGAVYVFRSPRCEVGGWTQFYVMPPERSVDIDTAEDLAEARQFAGS